MIVGYFELPDLVLEARLWDSWNYLVDNKYKTLAYWGTKELC